VSGQLNPSSYDAPQSPTATQRRSGTELYALLFAFTQRVMIDNYDAVRTAKNAAKKLYMSL
jgi:hypothetical protein